MFKQYAPKSQQKFVTFIKRIISPQLMLSYNLDGRSGKKALNSLKLLTCLQGNI